MVKKEEYFKQKRREIENKYAKEKFKALRNWGIAGMIAGAVMIYSGIKPKLDDFLYVKNNPKITQYKNVESTLDYLKERRESPVKIISLPYNSKEIEHYANKVFEKDKEVVKSLDGAIESTERELKNLKENPKIKEYAKFKTSNDKSDKIFYVGLGAFFLSCFYVLLHTSKSDALYEKEINELKLLQGIK